MSLPTAPGSIRIVSKRKGGTAATADEFVIDVDRSNPVLGNRHVLRNHRDSEERDRVIAANAADFAADVAAGGPMLAAVQEIADRLLQGQKIALRCWCEPEPCHARTYKAKAYELAGLSEYPSASDSSADVSTERARTQGALF